MYPVLIDLSFLGCQIRIYSYGFFIFLAAVIGLAATAVFIRKASFPFVRGMLLTGILSISFFVGARLLYAIIFYKKTMTNPDAIFKFDFSGFTLYGGLGLGLITVWSACRILNVDFLKFADLIAPAGGIAIAVSRIGCFLNGCCFGKVTGMPWGVTYPKLGFVDKLQIYRGLTGLFDSPLPVHPTQLYEMAAAFIASAAAFILLRKRLLPGIAAAVFGILLTMMRSIIFPFREYPSEDMLSGMVRGPITLGISFAFFAILFYFLIRKSRTDKIKPISALKYNS